MKELLRRLNQVVVTLKSIQVVQVKLIQAMKAMKRPQCLANENLILYYLQKNGWIYNPKQSLIKVREEEGEIITY